MLSTVLIANRGEIAVRIVRACQKLGITTIVACSTVDRESLAAQLADRAICIGPARAADSYLNPSVLVQTALGVGAEAVHPGYGFLSENAAFAQMCRDNGLVFIGPPAGVIRVMGSKLAARASAAMLGIPLLPGSERVDGITAARSAIADIGCPALIKAAAGGGGRGIRIVRQPGELDNALTSAAAEAEAAFGDGTLFIERYIESARHVEVQIVADQHGQVVHLGERDCSLQRRYQKVVEEAPAPDLPAHVRAGLRESAVRLAHGVGYQNVGTVEFVYDTHRHEYFFLEMNTRIQVEHPVTEEITGLDLVEMQLRIAAGEPLPFTQDDVRFTGHAIECRIAAEDPAQGFRPSPGRIARWDAPTGVGVRLDSHCYPGYVVPPFYDSLLAKLVVHAPDRNLAIDGMTAALDAMTVEGIHTTIPFLSELVRSADFRASRMSTTWIERRQ